MNDYVDGATLDRITEWLKRRPPEHVMTEAAVMVREFGISPMAARRIRSATGRDHFTTCLCCEAIGDHACGGECQRCGGSGRNPTDRVCRLPHSLDCGCSWAGEM